MSILSLLKLSRVPFAGFAAIGIGWGTFAAAIPDLKAALELTETQLGTALFFGAMGAITSMAASARIMSWFGTGRGLIGSVCAFLALAFTLPSFANSLVTLALSMTFVGLATGLLDVVINARISQIEARSGKPLMNLNHGGFSLAYAIAAICTGFGREAGLAPSQLYPVAATG